MSRRDPGRTSIRLGGRGDARGVRKARGGAYRSIELREEPCPDYDSGDRDDPSVAPGETIRFYVFTDAGEYQADIVRLTHGDTNPRGPGTKRSLSKPHQGTYEGRFRGVAASAAMSQWDDHGARGVAG